MNIVRMNTVADDNLIVRGEGSGGGGGVTIKNQDKSLEIVENGSVSITPDVGYTGLGKVNVNVDVPTQEINNQQKSVDITENGVTEVTADAGFTGLSKVIVNTNVQSGGGSDMPVIGDGKTYLYITIAAEGRMDVPLYFSQSVANGVTIDWGDGSAPQTLSGTGKVNTTHRYAAIGDYVISLDPADGGTFGLGGRSSSYCVMGSTGNNGRVYCNMLQAVEIGNGVTSIYDYAFYNCYSLSNIVIPEGVTSIGSYAFSNCYSLSSVVIPDSVTSIGSQAFQYCSSLSSVVIPDSVTSIGSQAFQYCYGMAFYDFSSHTSVPSLDNTNAFLSIPSDCKIIVPDALYDEWIAATNWSSYASQIIKKSDWDAQS